MSANRASHGVAVLHEPGLALPSLTWLQGKTAAVQAKLWELEGVDRLRWERIVRGAGVERRSAVVEPGEAMPMGTAQRMEAFSAHAPALASRAARQALQHAAVEPEEVTDLIVVTCTGFRSPGVGQEVAQTLGLGAGVRHSQIGFMGCFGGISGARAAAAIAGADPDAVVLLVCIELCSLHMRAEKSPQNLVACALFADGAAASIFTQSPRQQGAVARVDLGRSIVVPGTADAMTWSVTDHGFAMTLSREVPHELERRIGAFVAGDQALVIHPGGAGIIDAVEKGISAARADSMPELQAVGAGRVERARDGGPETCGVAMDPRSFQASRAILREHGNMSSGSVYFVLKELRRLGAPIGQPGFRARMVAFGPGLTVDSVALLPLG